MEKIKRILIILMITTRLVIRYGLLLTAAAFIFLVWNKILEKTDGIKIVELLFWIVTNKYILTTYILYQLYLIKKKRGIFYVGYLLVMSFIGNAIYEYYKSIQLILSNNFKEALYYSMNIFSWKVYFDLKAIDKKLLKNTSVHILNLTRNITSYFSPYWVTIDDYKENGTTKIFDLYRPQWLKEYELIKLESNDILHWIWLSVDKYSLNLNVKGNIQLIITEILDNVNYPINEYIWDFKKDTIYFWFDDLWKMISKQISFTEANHLGIYWTTGSWKTNYTSTMLLYLYLVNQNYNFIVIDPKWDLGAFKSADRIRYAHSTEDMVKLLEEVNENMWFINKKFNDIWVRNYNEYISESKEDNPLIKPTFVFLEEFSLLLSKAESIDEKNREKIIRIVKNIAIAGRSVAFNLIFSLQVPLIWVIKDSEISRMLKTVSFRLDNSLNSNAFWSQIPIDISTLKVGEWVFKDNIWYQKFKAFYIPDSEYKKIPQMLTPKKSHQENYLEYAKKVGKFNYNEALKFWLNNEEVKNLSRELKEKWILQKLPDNSLIFTSKKRE